MKHFLRVLPLCAMAHSARAEELHDSPTLVAVHGGQVFGASDRTVMEWDASTGNLVRTITWPGNRGLALLTTTHDGKLVIASDHEGKIGVWDLAQGKVIRTIDGALNGAEANAFDVSPDDRVVAMSSDLDVKLFDLATGKLIRAIKLESSRAGDVRYAPDGKSLAILSFGMQFYSAAGDRLADFGDSVKESAGHKPFHTVAWTPDGQRVIAAGAYLVMADPKKPHVVADVGHDFGSNNHHLLILPDGKWAALSIDGGPGGTGGIAWYALPSLTFKATWKLANVSGMAVTGDGKVLAVAQPDATVKLLDPAANKLTVLHTLKISPAPVANAPAGAPPNAPDAPKGKLPAGSEKLMSALGYAVQNILMEDDRSDESRVASDAKECVDGVAALIALHVPEATEVRVGISKPIEGARPAPNNDGMLLTIANIRDHLCGLGKTGALANDVSAKAANVANWIGRMKHPDKDKPFFGNEDIVLSEAKTCLKAVAAAKQGKVPSTQMIEFFVYQSELKSPMSLADIEEKVCNAGTALAQKSQTEGNAAEKAQYAPYLKVLSGDKAKMFWEKRMLAGENWYGHGKRSLTKPADFASSDVWYYYVVDRNHATPSWEVEGWTFAGSKNTGVYDKSGSGESPPSSAFR